MVDKGAGPSAGGSHVDKVFGVHPDPCDDIRTLNTLLFLGQRRWYQTVIFNGFPSFSYLIFLNVGGRGLKSNKYCKEA